MQTWNERAIPVFWDAVGIVKAGRGKARKHGLSVASVEYVYPPSSDSV